MAQTVANIDQILKQHYLGPGLKAVLFGEWTDRRWWAHIAPDGWVPLDEEAPWERTSSGLLIPSGTSDKEGYPLDGDHIHIGKVYIVPIHVGKRPRKWRRQKKRRNGAPTRRNFKAPHPPQCRGRL